MKDPRDAERQTATARELLTRLFSGTDDRRRELQLLADEVGMGKTFVALATAYSVLEAMDGKEPIQSLEGCYQKVLIVTPPNVALFNKWNREVSEFARRCLSDDVVAEAHERFQPIRADRLDELVAAIRRRGGRGGRIVVTTMNVFGDRKLRHYDLKRRFLLGVVFRHWGQRFNNEVRERLLKGAPAHWPTSPYHLTELNDWEAAQLPFSEDEALIALERLDRPSRDQALMDTFLETCRNISEPYRRDRQELFKHIEHLLTKVYRALSEEMLNRSFPLVIVDEAHNWKNGPSKGANGYANFATLIAARTRRLLLLTATPFQLRPAEMIEILQISEHLEYAADSEVRARRKKRLVYHCQEVIKPALRSAEQASRRFSRDWSRIHLSTETIARFWNSPSLLAARAHLRELRASNGNDQAAIERIARDAVADLDPEHRAFFRHALTLHILNERLSAALGKLVIRHRRHTDHRLTLVGEEYVFPEKATAREDRHVLHAAAGLDVRGDGELPHYLLMRCVTAIKGKGRSSLGSALTGCYSTLLESAEGRQLQKKFRDVPESRAYFDTLFSMVRGADDPKHPKLSKVVESAITSWRNGEKTLIFCFRINTAQRLREIIATRIRAELHQRRKKCLGGEESLRALRGRMTRRDGDLIVLGMDRVLLSLAQTAGVSLPRDDLTLRPDDVREVARQALRYGQELLDDRVDRVFLHRAIEHAVARRLRSNATAEIQHLLAEVANHHWIEHPYGLEFSSDSDDPASEDVAHVDERGVHAYYATMDDRPSPRAVEDLTQALLERRERARRSSSVPILDSYFEAPSLWLGPTPAIAQTPPAALSVLHHQLFHLTFDNNKTADWKTRLLVMQALRRALLRESMLLRLLPEKADRDESSWGELLAQRFLAPLPRQHESMADRVAIFTEDILSASGSAEDRTSARYNLLDATRLRDQNFVALVLGGGDQQARERIFAGFNSPLLPEVLVCTSVGAEGIDLHRHCRRIVHYDLAWNPAVLEQRTGRIDRIGSKTFREREAAVGGDGPSLEVGVPFLAGTYDERMFEELRMRAQTFEVLTGGDITSDSSDDDDLSGADEQKTSEGRDLSLHLKSLPPGMLSDLRVNLHVWIDASEKAAPRL